MAAVSHRRRRRLDYVVRTRPSAAGHAHRTDPDDPRRSGEGRAARTGAEFPDWPAGQRFGAAADLGGGVLEKCVCRGHVRSWTADLRHRHRRNPERADSQCDRASGDGRTVGCRLGCSVAGRGRRTTDGVRGGPSTSSGRGRRRQDNGRVQVRLAGVLQRARYRGRAGAGIHAGRAFVQSLRGRRFRSDRARAVAECRCARPGRAPRPGSHCPKRKPFDAPAAESRTFTVVGVVRDVPGFRIAPFKEAVVYVPTDATMRQDLARRARPRRSRTGTADASQSIDQHRSRHRTRWRPCGG